MAGRRKAADKPAVSPERMAEIRRSIEGWEAGKWALEVDYGPACVCGLRKENRCYAHPERTVAE